MSSNFTEASHWRERAAEMRAIADGYKDKEAAAIMRRLAHDYDRPAERAEARSESGLQRLPSARPKDGRT